MIYNVAWRKGCVGVRLQGLVQLSFFERNVTGVCGFCGYSSDCFVLAEVSACEI